MRRSSPAIFNFICLPSSHYYSFMDVHSSFIFNSKPNRCVICVNSARSVPTARAKTTERMLSVWDSSLPTPSIKPSVKPMRRSSSGRQRRPPPRALPTTAMERMTMVPSGGFQAAGGDRVKQVQLSAAAAAAAAAGAGDTRTAADPGAITPRADLSTLFNFPESVHPAYRPLPTPMRVGLAVLSAMLAAASTYTKTARLFEHNSWRKTVGLFARFALRALVIGAMTTTVIQEAFLRPSRIDTTTLVARGGFLPPFLGLIRSKLRSRSPPLEMQVPSWDLSGFTIFDTTVTTVLCQVASSALTFYTAITDSGHHRFLGFRHFPPWRNG